MTNVSEEPRMTCNEVSLQKGIRPKSLARRPNDFEHLRQTCNEGSSTMQDTWASQTTLSQPQNDGLAINQPTAHLTAALTAGRLQRSRVSTDIRRVFEQQAMKQLVQSPVQNPQTGFFELGLKSGDLMELSTKLSDALDRPIQVSTLFDYPTMDALLEHFRGVVGEKKMSYALQQTNVVPAAPVVASASCVLPGGVSSPQQLGSTLSQGHHGAICRVPPERWSLAGWWDPDPAASNKMYTQHGGFLGAGVVQNFDAVFFGFSKTEARTMSPSQRLVLEHAVQVLCGTNQSIAGLRGQKIGVFVGSCHHDWEHLECNKNSSSPYTTTGIAASVLAG
jgi:acyl transferase domain-containing protein